MCLVHLFTKPLQLDSWNIAHVPNCPYHRLLCCAVEHWRRHGSAYGSSFTSFHTSHITDRVIANSSDKIRIRMFSGHHQNKDRYMNHCHMLLISRALSSPWTVGDATLEECYGQIVKCWANTQVFIPAIPVGYLTASQLVHAWQIKSLLFGLVERPYVLNRILTCIPSNNWGEGDEDLHPP